MLKIMAAVLAATTVAACSDTSDEALFDDQALITVTAGSAAIADPKRWTGVQACMGSGDNRKSIDTTSAEATLESFTKTKTRVSITGIDVGPNDTYSCSGLTFDGVVTDADTGHVSFETATDDTSRQLRCDSATGRPLVVGWLRGYDSDLSRLDGPWNLHFRIRIEEPVDEAVDAGVRSSRVNIQCEFDFTLD